MTLAPKREVEHRRLVTPATVFNLEDMAREALDRLRHGVVILDLNSEFLFRNRHFLNLFSNPADLAALYRLLDEAKSPKEAKSPEEASSPGQAGDDTLLVSGKSLHVGRVPILGGTLVTI